VPSSVYTASLPENFYNTPQRNTNKYPVSQRGGLGWFPVYVVWIFLGKSDTETNFLLSSSVSPANSQHTNCSYSLIMVSLSLFFLCIESALINILTRKNMWNLIFSLTTLQIINALLGRWSISSSSSLVKSYVETNRASPHWTWYCFMSDISCYVSRITCGITYLLTWICLVFIEIVKGSITCHSQKMTLIACRNCTYLSRTIPRQKERVGVSVTLLMKILSSGVWPHVDRSLTAFCRCLLPPSSGCRRDNIALLL
jgi:hypothetical protein